MSGKLGRAALAAAVAAAVVAGCGDTDEHPRLKVSAAASLKQAFGEYAEQFDAATPAMSFAGSDELAAQIEAGGKPDVYAAANTRLPNALHAKGLLERPRTFATNRLVIAVPAGGSAVKSLDDLAEPGVSIAAGSPSVPVGAYTRKALAALPPVKRAAILGNIKSNEPDVPGVIGKVSQGAVDAGFVYVTDVKGAGGRLRAIALPDDLSADVAYGIAMVKDASHPEAAREFIDGLFSGAGRRALERAGFGPPPS